jgi:hypothetical protein
MGKEDEMGMNEMNALGLGSEWWWGCGQLECLVRFLPVPFRYSMQHQPYPLNAACTSAPKTSAPFKVEQSSYSNYLQKYKKIIVIYLKYIYNGKNMS